MMPCKIEEAFIQDHKYFACIHEKSMDIRNNLMDLRHRGSDLEN